MSRLTAMRAKTTCESTPRLAALRQIADDHADAELAELADEALKRMLADE
ncbi:MAG: hypothetical protein AB7S26_19135 [Sandaracinaceae bacterium]